MIAGGALAFVPLQLMYNLAGAALVIVVVLMSMRNSAVSPVHSETTM